MTRGLLQAGKPHERDARPGEALSRHGGPAVAFGVRQQDLRSRSFLLSNLGCSVVDSKLYLKMILVVPFIVSVFTERAKSQT